MFAPIKPGNTPERVPAHEEFREILQSENVDADLAEKAAEDIRNAVLRYVRRKYPHRCRLTEIERRKLVKTCNQAIRLMDRAHPRPGAVRKKIREISNSINRFGPRGITAAAVRISQRNFLMALINSNPSLEARRMGVNYLIRRAVKPDADGKYGFPLHGYGVQLSMLDPLKYRSPLAARPILELICQRNASPWIADNRAKPEEWSFTLEMARIYHNYTLKAPVRGNTQFAAIYSGVITMANLGEVKVEYQADKLHREWTGLKNTVSITVHGPLRNLMEQIF